MDLATCDCVEPKPIHAKDMDWKVRALAAEELNHKFMASVNGPTFMGEPASSAGLSTDFEQWWKDHRDDDWGCAVPKQTAWNLWCGMHAARTPSSSPVEAGAGEPVAWMRDAGEDSLSTMSFCCTNAVKQLWLKANPNQVERYTIPLYAHPASAPQAGASSGDATRALLSLSGMSAAKEKP